MFLGAWPVRYRKKSFFKSMETLLHGFALRKSLFQTVVIDVYVLQCFYKKGTVFATKRTVYKFAEGGSFSPAMPDNKFIGTIVHQGHKPSGAFYNLFPLAPGERGRQKSCYLNVFFFCKSMGDTNRIIFNKRTVIVFMKVFFQKIGKQGVV